MPNQWTDPSLSGYPAEQAVRGAACGPAAAVALLRSAGGEMTLREAVDLARANNLWSTSLGMFGPESERRLLELVGVTARLEWVHDWASVLQLVDAGKVVIVDCPLHYFVIDGYVAGPLRVHAGNSGLAFRNGAEWMTVPQLEALAGGMRALLYVEQ